MTIERRIKPRYLFGLLTAVTIFFVLFGNSEPPTAVYTQESDITHHVLILNAHNFGAPWPTAVNQAISDNFAQQHEVNIRTHVEYSGLAQNFDETYEQNLFAFYQHKYRNIPLELIIAVDVAATNFIIEYGGELFPNVPVVFVTGGQTHPDLDAYPYMTGVSDQIEIPHNIEIALQLHPRAKHIAVIAGADEIGQAYAGTIWQALEPYADQYDLIDLVGLPMDDILAEVAQLPDDSIIFYAVTLVDGAGQRFVPQQIIPRISQTANAPIYSFWDTLLGHGIVGGYLSNTEAIGRKLAAMSLQILDGTPPHEIPLEQGAYAYLYDWEQLQRWNINANRLPADSEIRNHTPSFWQLYWQEILIAGVIIGLQALLIFVLLRSRGQLKQVQQALARSHNSLEVQVAERTAALSQTNQQLQTQIAERKQAEETLRVREARFRNSNEASLDALYLLESVHDETGEIVDFCIVELNENAVQQMGVPREQLLGGLICEMFPVNRTNGYFEQYKQVVLTGEPLMQEYMIPAEHAAPGWYYHQVVRVGDGVAIVNRDITDRKQMGIALQDSEERYRQLADNAPMAVTVTAVADGQVLYVNEKAAQLFGTTVTEALQSKGLSYYVHPERRAQIVQQLIQQGYLNDFEIELQKQSGEKFWVSMNARVSTFADQPAIHAVYIDITKRKQMEIALQEKHTELEQFFSTALDLLCIADSNGRFLRVNKEWENVLGYTTDQLEGQHFLDFVHPDDLQPTLDAIATLTTQQPILNFTNRYQTKEGDYRIIEWRSHPRGDLIYASARDITNRELAAQALKQSEAMLSAFFEATPEAVSLWDADLNLVQLNSNATAMYSPELQAKGLVGRHLTELAPRIKETDRHEAYQQIVQTGQPRRWPDVPYGDRMLDIRAFKAGQFLGTMVADVTEQHRAAEQLRLSEAKKAAILDSMDDLLFVFDRDLTYLEFHQNQANNKLLIDPADFLGKRFTDIPFPEPAYATILTALTNCLQTNQGQNAHYYLDTPNGRIWEDLKVTPLTDGQDNTIGLTAVVRNITAYKEREQQLATLSQRLSGILTGTNAGTWEWNVQTGTTIFNERWAEIIGYSLAEISPTTIETWANFAHPDDLQASSELLDKHFRGELDYYECETRMKHKNGDWVWVLDRGRVVSWTDDGRPLMMMGTHQDMTVRKRMETALLLSEERFRSAFDSAAHGIALITCAGQFMQVNQAFCQIVGYTAAELAILNYIIFTHPDDLPVEKEFLGQLLRGEIETYHVEKRFIHKQGRIVWVMFSGALVRDGDGQPDYLIAQAIDITERVQAEQTLRERTTQLEVLRHVGLELTAQLNLDELLHSVTASAIELLNGDGGGVYLYDPQADVLVWSVSVNSPYPLGRTSRKGEGLGGQIWAEQRPLFHNQYHEWEHRIEADEVDSLQAVAGVPIYWAEQFMGVLMVTQTVTLTEFTHNDVELLSLLATQTAIAIRNARLFDEAEEARQAAEAANQAKSAFLSHMSHELRTPLNSILGYTQLHQADSNLTERQQTNFGVIRRSGEHLLLMINDILDLSKIEAGKLSLRTEECYLPGFLRTITEMIAVQAEEKGLTFTYQPDTNLPTMIIADETRLRQVLLNLLSNAVKFTISGGVVLKVAHQPDAEKTAVFPAEMMPTSAHLPILNLRFTVEDDGVGIDAEELETIFEPFHQADNLPKAAYGTGLGLAISQRLVKMMGGTIKAESTPQQGSRFWFDLPLPILDWPEQTAVSPTTCEIHAADAQLKVLLVDDDPNGRTFLSQWLTTVGFAVYTAEDGAQAIEQAAVCQPDIILMDMMMPVMDGLTAVRQLRQNPAHQQTTIVAVSANAYEQDRDIALQAGCDAFIAKPVQLATLWQTLQAHLPADCACPTKELLSLSAPEPPPTRLPLPTEETAVLLTAVTRGDMRRIHEQLATLKNLDEPYQPMVAELEQLAKQYKLKQMRQLLSDEV